jgi:Fe-S oxidoreductase
MLKRLEDYRRDLYQCGREGYCKWVNAPEMKSATFSNICPSFKDGKFHAYACGGRLNIAWCLLEGNIDYTDKMLDAVYRCTLCGGCEMSCNVINGNRIANNEILHALRVKCVEDGQILPEHQAMIESLKKEDTPLVGESKAKRGDWAEGLGLKDATKEKVDVLFHAGCRFSLDATLLKQAGVDLGIEGREEACCGGRAFHLGFMNEIEKYADDMISKLKASGATKIVTPCADCYSNYKYYYPWIERKLGIEILHITEFFDQLVKEGKLKFKKEISLRVTYHDPCHLGRLGEDYETWNGEWKKVRNHLVISDPPRPLHTGAGGVYEPPRNILKAIPGLELAEMERTKWVTWCCGAGGGALEAFPDFAFRTAMERIKEAKATGAEALVTACPWCERTFKNALEESGSKFKIYDITELIMLSEGGIK